MQTSKSTEALPQARDVVSTSILFSSSISLPFRSLSEPIKPLPIHTEHHNKLPAKRAVHSLMLTHFVVIYNILSCPYKIFVIFTQKDMATTPFVSCCHICVLSKYFSSFCPPRLPARPRRQKAVSNNTGPRCPAGAPRSSFPRSPGALPAQLPRGAPRPKRFR